MLRNKRFLCFLFLLLFCSCSFVKSKTADRGLPAWPLLYLEFEDLAKRSDLLLESKFWSYLKGLDLESVEYAKTINDIEDSISSPAWRELFGSELLIALYPIDKKQILNTEDQLELLKNNLEQVVFVGRMSVLAKAISHLAILLKNSTSDIRVIEERFEGSVFYTLSTGEQNIYFLKKYGYIYLSPSKDLLKRCAMTIKNNKLSLAKQKSHIQYRVDSEPSDWGAGYLDFDRLKILSLKFLASSIDNIKVDEQALVEQQQWIEQLKHFSGIERFTFRLKDQYNDISSLALSAEFDAANLSEFLSYTVSKANRDNECLKHMPANTKFFFWYANMELDLWWESFVLLNSKERVEFIINKVNDYTGLELKTDILPLIGDQFSLSLAHKQNDKKEFPSLALQLSSRNSDYGIKLLDHLWARQPIPAKIVKYRDLQVRRSSVKLADSIEPAYVAIEDTLVLNSSFSQLRKMIDNSRKSGATLLDEESFAGAALGLNDKSLSSSYLDFDYFAQKAKDSLTSARFSSWLDANTVNSNLSKVLKSNVLPLVESFDFIEQILSRLYKDDDRINLDVFIKLKNK